MTPRGPLTVLHVAAPGAVGGLERVLHALAAGLARCGHRVHVAAVLDEHQSEPPFLEALRDAGVRVHPIPLPPRAYLQERREVHRLCRVLSPDVVHTHSDRPDVLDAPVARRLGIPTVTTLHGSSKMGGKATLYEWLQLRALRRFDGVIAVARPLVREAEERGVRPERIHLIPNAWHPGKLPMEANEARRRLGVPLDVPVIGWVGRLIPIKAVDVFIEALSRLRAPAWQAVVIGDGPVRGAAESLCRERGLAGRVSFLGAIPEAATLYRGFDVFALSSHSEGTPITLFEAMAARVPIVATAVGGVPEVLEGTDARLVEPRQPQALAEAIDAAINSDGTRDALTIRAADRLSTHYGLGPWLDAHERVYRRLAGARAVAQPRRSTTSASTIPSDASRETGKKPVSR